jgi:hypothetical protein
MDHPTDKKWKIVPDIDGKFVVWRNDRRNGWELAYHGGLCTYNSERGARQHIADWKEREAKVERFKENNPPIYIE